MSSDPGRAGRQVAAVALATPMSKQSQERSERTECLLWVESGHSTWAQTHTRIVDYLCQTQKSALSGESSTQQRSRRAKTTCGKALLRLSVLWENPTKCCAVTAENARKMTPRSPILRSARP